MRKRALGRQEHLKKKKGFVEDTECLEGGQQGARRVKKVKKLSNKKMQKRNYIAGKDCNVV